MRFLYSLFMYLATPFALGYFGLRGLRDARYWHRWRERLGFWPAPRVHGAVLVHCSSMGEVNAASPLVHALLEGPAPRSVLLTTITPTGAQRALDLFADRLEVRHLPLDLPGACKRLMRRYQPAALVIMETEIWPNLFHAASCNGVPVLMANARLSERSVRAYQRLGGLIRPTLGLVSRILAQTDRDASRFVACGATRERVQVTGNLKFDVALPDGLAESRHNLRAEWGKHRPVLTAGSTHRADEMVLFAAFNRLLADLPDALLVLAPRHPERFAEAAESARQAGLAVHLHSSGPPVPSATQCLVVDTMGQLLAYYAAGDVAFVGGTLAPVGGHNVLEPAALGRPVLVGPHTDNVTETLGQLLQAGAAERIGGEDELLTACRALFDDADRRARMGAAACKLVASGRGALAKTLQSLNALPGAGGKERTSAADGR